MRSTERIDVAITYGDEWCDEELNALFTDLFGSGFLCEPSEFGCVFKNNEHCGNGLAEALDAYRCGDIEWYEYEEQVARFKRKWLRRSDEDAYDFYRARFEKIVRDTAEKFKNELDVNLRSLDEQNV